MTDKQTKCLIGVYQKFDIAIGKCHLNVQVCLIVVHCAYGYNVVGETAFYCQLCPFVIWGFRPSKHKYLLSGFAN